MNSATRVVNAAASSFQIGMRQKFSTIFTVALMQVAIKIIFSFFIGIKMHWLKNQPYIQNINAIHKIFSDISAEIYVTSEIANITFLLTQKRPTTAGSSNVVTESYTFCAVFLKSVILPLP